MGFSNGGWLDWLRKADKRWLWIVLGSRWIGDRVPDYGSSRLDCRLTFARRLPWCRALPSPWIIHPKLSHTAGTVVRITMRRQLWSFYRQFRFFTRGKSLPPLILCCILTRIHVGEVRDHGGSERMIFFAMWTSKAVLHMNEIALDVYFPQILSLFLQLWHLFSSTFCIGSIVFIISMGQSPVPESGKPSFWPVTSGKVLEKNL